MPRPTLRGPGALLAFAGLIAAMSGTGTAAGADQPDPGSLARPMSQSAGASVADPTGGTTRDADYRTGSSAPTTSQRQQAARTATGVRWNRFGTPATLVPAPAAQPKAAASADPVQVARDYLTRNAELFRVSADAVRAMDVQLKQPMGKGSIVMLRQRFGSLPAANEGLVSLGISAGQVVYVSSTLSPEASTQPAPATLSEADALAAAAANADVSVDQLAISRVRLAALPMPSGGARTAYQVVLIGKEKAHPTAFTTYVDARSGEVLLREDLADQHSDNPEWDVFPANPPADYSTNDTRVTWCLIQRPGCERAVSAAGSGIAWDVDPATGAPSQTSSGNQARTTEKWDLLTNNSVGTRTSTPSPTRDYTYPWTNQWYENRCDPDVFATARQNDIDAAIANLFAGHNRMHDWSYHLGFTERTWNLQTANGTAGGLGNDPELGNAQAGGRAGGAPPEFASRNNANQITPPDGVPAITNMFLWQPVAGAFYAPCVDGDYDMSVIGHEYAHAISGRLIGGPDRGWSGDQAGAMNESHSDLFAMEYLYGYGFRPRGNTPYVVGGYATGDLVTGIRNYDMSKSPLNYSNVAYDLVGEQVHADGEIWSATSFDVRQALIDRYGIGTPAQQRACADGKVPVESCPGNRRWVQLEFDALLLSADPAVSMVDLRNAMLAADQIRFGGVNAPLLWTAFAQHGLGRDASSAGPNDENPVPSFASPYGRNATVRIAAAGQASGRPIKLYVGEYEGRSMPIADTDPATPLPDTAEIAPGSYSFIAAGEGFGSKSFSLRLGSGQQRTLPLVLQRNLASGSSGATATGDGVNLDRLIDDTEATNWASVGSPVQGKAVTVDLAGDRATLVSRIQVSALLRPQVATDPDPIAQNRFTALRRFEVLSCNTGTGSDCADDADYRSVYTSPSDAFPANAPRPTAPDLKLRSFRIRPTVATHLRLRVLTNQCTGGPAYAGSQHDDPRSTSDCTTGNPAVAQQVRIAELQAFTV
ncbi:M36 family metallopeptidase [Kribbella sp. CA-253562]|uniref:M36 family metallopeptidase n=1 Tax=Kribbella sp. CA-253562 TaxID=3239942 RepID=UPI003D8D60E5